MVRAFFVGTKDKQINTEGATYILPISVGQHYHDGDRFEAIISLLNRRKFRSGRIVIASTLQRHTLGLIYPKLTEEDLIELARRHGLEWQARNMPILNQLDHPFEIVDWDLFLETDAYKNRLIEVTTLYQDSSFFCKKIDETVDNFLKRWSLREGIKNYTTGFFKNQCKKYLFEECCVASLWVGEGFNYEIYPSSLSPAMDAMYKHFITPYYPDELVWLRVNFRGTSSIKKPVNSSSSVLTEM